MNLLKQSTARNLMVFMTDSADHVAGKTGLTLTITASKDGGAFASITPTVTERATGWYSLALTTAHTDTLGDFVLHITGTGADPTDLRCQVVAALPGENVTVGGFTAGAITAAAIATDAIDGDAIAASAVTEIQSGLALSTQVDALEAAAIAIEADTQDIQSRLPAALVSGRIDASVGAMATDVITNTALAASAVTEIQSGLATSAAQANQALSTQVDALEGGMVTALVDLDDIQTRLPAALVGGRMDASVGAMAADTLTASALATDAREEIADQVWDELIAGHAGVGSTGAALAAAGGSGDPWTTALPGAYGAGSAGYIIGTYIDAAISSRLATAGYTAPANADIAAIKAKTDSLSFTVANRVDVNVRLMNGATVLGNGTAGDLWRG